MDMERPNPPDGVRDLNSQPAVASDRRLLDLRDKLEVGLPDEVFDDLSRWPMPDEPEAEQDDAYRERALAYVKECIEYRETIRPDSLRAPEELPEEVERVTAGAWVWYHGDYEVEHSRPETDAKDVEAGKYLLFAPGDARVLEDVVLEEFQQRPYTGAKLPTKPGKKEDWVLCLYQPDNRYWYDVKDAHHNEPTVRFRGFKTNAATKRGDYSDRFENAQ